MRLLYKFNETNIPKKKDDMKLTIEVFSISKSILIFKFFCMNILSINPKVLPIKTIPIELKSKVYIFIQPFVILLGLSRRSLEDNLTLTQNSPSYVFQFRKIVIKVPELISINLSASISG